MSDLYQEVNCAKCGVRFTIELARGRPIAPFCTECAKKVNHKVAQRAKPEVGGSSSEGSTEGE